MKTTLQHDLAIIFLLTLLLLVLVGSPLQEWQLASRVCSSPKFFSIAGPPLLYAWRYHYALPELFALRPISGRTILLTSINAAAALVLLDVVVTGQSMIFPPSSEYQAFWTDTWQQFAAQPLVVTWFCIAVFPGFCEELLFRGFLLSGLRQRWPAPVAIISVALLFGAFHFDPYKFVPVMLLGGLFGYLVVRTGSVFTGIIAHVTNNTLTLLLSVSAQRMASLPTKKITEIAALPPETLAQMAMGLISLVEALLAWFL